MPEDVVEIPLPIGLEVRTGRRPQVPAQAEFLLEQDHIVPAGRRHQRRFHPSRTAAHHHHLLLLRRELRRGPVVVLTHRPRVDGAPHRQAVSPADEATVAADAGDGIVFAPPEGLLGQSRVGDEGPAESHKIHLPGSHPSPGLVQVHDGADDPHGHLGDRLLDLRGPLQVLAVR